MNEATLQIRNLCVNYQGYEVLKDISMDIGSGESVCIFGKNGAGKSTLLKAIAGLTPVESGSILLNGFSIDRLNTRERIEMGIGYVMQHESVFPRLTVNDHIRLAAHQNGRKAFSDIWAEISAAFPAMAVLKGRTAGKLSGGQKRLLSCAMLVAQGANNLWLLDEPSAGVAKTGLDEIGLFLNNYLREHNITCLLVEQNTDFGKSITFSNYYL